MTKYIDKLNNHLSRGSEEQYNEMKLECSLHKYTNIFGILKQNYQGSTNCSRGDEPGHNLYTKKFLHAQNYMYVHQSKHL